MSRRSNSIIEVAKAAGVSTATVSRVLNGLPGVREETITQVRAAMTELNYTRLRTRAARKRQVNSNYSGKTGNIAVITIGHSQEWLSMPVMATTLNGIQRGVNSNGLRLSLDGMPSAAEPSKLLVDRQIDGAIVYISSDLPTSQYDSTFKAIQRYVPIVWAMGMEMSVSGVDHVSPDNVGIGHLAYSYLQSKGCKRPAFLTTNPNWPLMRLRGQSFLNSAYDDGKPPVVYTTDAAETAVAPYGQLIVRAPDLETLVEKFVKSPDRPDGLFSGNDDTTSRIYPLLIRHGIKIGKDVHIISCDAEEARLSGMYPRPMSIDIGGSEIGFRAVNRLLNRIDRPNGPPLIIQVAPRLYSGPTAPATQIQG